MTLTFGRAVSNLSPTLSGIDNAPTGATAGSVFTDRVTLDGYAATGDSPITLRPAATLPPAPPTSCSGYSGTSPAQKNNAITGTANNNASTAANVTVTFPSPVTRLVVAFENIAAFTTTNAICLQASPLRWAR